jgi:hypothetical protein
MQDGPYAVEPFHNQWVISARGAKILICNKKRTALAIVQRASRLLASEEGRMPAPEQGMSSQNFGASVSSQVPSQGPPLLGSPPGTGPRASEL